jgi:DNA polymerase-1
MSNEQKKILIIDSHSVLHRAFHALPPLTTKKGEIVNAAYGFCLVFLKVLKEFKPDFVAATFDLPGPCFRHEKFKEYKGKRLPTAKELIQQFDKTKEILRAFGVSIFEKQGFEADDIIGTIVSDIRHQGSNARPVRGREDSQRVPVSNGVNCIILSGDLDTLQLIDEKTKVYFLRKGVKDTMLYDTEGVKQRYENLAPSQLIDYKALRGDPSDNISGVPGVGEKTALKLIREFASLENLYSALEQQSFTETMAKSINQSVKTKLVENKEQAFLSKFLVQIRRDVPLDFKLEDCQFKGIDKEKANQIFEKFEFYALIKRINSDEFLC